MNKSSSFNQYLIIEVKECDNDKLISYNRIIESDLSDLINFLNRPSMITNTKTVITSYNNKFLVVEWNNLEEFKERFNRSCYILGLNQI